METNLIFFTGNKKLYTWLLDQLYTLSDSSDNVILSLVRLQLCVMMLLAVRDKWTGFISLAMLYSW